MKFEAKPKKFINKNKTNLNQIQENEESSWIEEEKKEVIQLDKMDSLEQETNFPSLLSDPKTPSQDEKPSLKKRLSDKAKGLQRTSQAFYSSSELVLENQNSNQSLPQAPEEDSAKTRKASSSNSKFKIKNFTSSDSKKSSFVSDVNKASMEKERPNLSKLPSFWTAKRFPVKENNSKSNPSNSV